MWPFSRAATTTGSVPSGTEKVQSGWGQFTAMLGGRQIETSYSSLSSSRQFPVRLTGLLEIASSQLICA